MVRNSLRRRTRAVVEAAAPTLPRGAYLVRLEPSAASTDPSTLRHDVARALAKAGRSRVPA